MDAIDRKSIHHRDSSYVLGAGSQFFEMSICAPIVVTVRKRVVYENVVANDTSVVTERPPYGIMYAGLLLGWRPITIIGSRNISCLI